MGGGSSSACLDDLDRLSSSTTVSVDLGPVTVTAPASVLQGVKGNGSLTLSQTPSSSSTIAQISSLLGNLGTPVVSYDIDLTQTGSGGTSQAIHQLGGSITISIHLTDEELARLSDASRARLMYLDPSWNKLVDMGATFDPVTHTFTCTSSHFSTFVIVQYASSTQPIQNPKTGSTNSPVFPLAIVSACSASGLIILKKRRAIWKVKSNTANK